MHRLNEQIINGLIRTYGKIEPDHLLSLGIEMADMNLLTTEHIWTPTQRQKARRTLDLIMFGAMEIAGLPQFRVPAEYIGACIACYVNPANWMIACYTVAASVATEDIDRDEDVERVTPEKLFALICMAKSEAIDDFKAKLEKRTSAAIEEAEKKEGVKKDGKA